MHIRLPGLCFWLPFISLILLFAMAATLTVGRYPLSVSDIIEFSLAAAGFHPMDKTQFALFYNLIMDIRLPRIFAAVLVGAALAVSGAAYQAVFRNPLVSPSLLGALGGAAFGAALGMLISENWLTVQLLSFLMGMLAVGFGVLIAALFGKMSIIMLILGGIISGGLFAALLSIIKYLADTEETLPTIVYWLMGSLSRADLSHMLWLSIPVLAGIIVLSLMGRLLDILAMGDDEAHSLGVNVQLVRTSVILIATLICTLTVSVAGMIGWVGLIVPHVARMLAGPGNTTLLPLSALLGALFLLLCDTFARSATAVEIPIGIITELVGVPVFLLVLNKAKKGWT